MTKQMDTLTPILAALPGLNRRRRRLLAALYCTLMLIPVLYFEIVEGHGAAAVATGIIALWLMHAVTTRLDSIELEIEDVYGKALRALHDSQSSNDPYR